MEPFNAGVFVWVLRCTTSSVGACSSQYAESHRHSTDPLFKPSLPLQTSIRLHPLQKAHERVLHSFANLDEAWTSRASRALWASLPAEAVTRLLGCGQLAAASENVVYVVVASWLAAQLK